ncbi:MAG TPA: hypothetical protein VF559_07980 [Caulobacteraceae bacterium]
MDKLTIARELAGALHAAEATVDEAFADIGALGQALTRSRRDLNLAATVGDPAFSHVGQALALVASARAELVRAHEELAIVQRRVGLGATSFGGLEKPKASAEDAPATHLRRVG